MINFFIRNWLPKNLRIPLWGDRERWGLVAQQNDSCWKEWINTYLDFYDENQREGIGIRINDAGYHVMSEIDLTGKRILEIGPGDIRHIAYWNGVPEEYMLADIQLGMLNKAEKKLTESNIPYKTILLEKGNPIPVGDESLDVVVSFYSLEHIYPLSPILEEINRVLKPGGMLIGAIPTEGGLAWGLGRMLTSRRWFKRNTSIDPDKIICWEHPNYADSVVFNLEKQFECNKQYFWPFKWLAFLDFNLILKFLYVKKGG